MKVDETPLYTQKEEIGIYRRPVIRVMLGEEEISTDSPWFLSLNSSVSPQIIMSGSSALTTASVEGTLLEKLGLSGIIDLLSEESVGVLQQKGITLRIPAEAQGKQIVMDWGKSWNELLKEETMYSLRYVLADEQGKQRELDWQIVVSDMNVQAVEIPRFETWADRTVFYGEVIEGHTPGAETVYSFQYRKKGEEAWSQNIPAVLSGQTIKSDVLKGLTPGTTYEYRILEDTKISNMICEVTTESVFLLDNNSFEYTSRDGKVLRISPDPSNYWWDSGNEGSATLGVDVTYPDTSVKHSGSQSLKLQSQYVAVWGIGKFAAGNLFAGEFLDTEDAYYGILGWGRTCTTRPLALRAWVRYTPGTVDYTETDKISKGDKDKGIIYIAVGDWVSDDANYGSQWPVVVRTKGPKLFNPKDTGTIGYGEMIFTDNVGLDENGGMKEVIIPLNYDNYGGRTRIPTHIIIVASASQYGDYYSGSTGSVMWLDDLELIYEESKLPENLR